MKMNHPHVIKLIEFFEDEDRIILITEFCSNGDI